MSNKKNFQNTIHEMNSRLENLLSLPIQPNFYLVLSKSNAQIENNTCWNGEKFVRIGGTAFNECQHATSEKAEEKAEEARNLGYKVLVVFFDMGKGRQARIDKLKKSIDELKNNL